MLFADVQGFTDFADAHEPEEVLNFLKIFFSEMNTAIIEHNGIIDKLMGDGILDYRLNKAGKKTYGLKNRLLLHAMGGIGIDIFCTTQDCWSEPYS